MSVETENSLNEEPTPTGIATQINEISGGAVAIGRGAVATAVYHGLTTAEVADLLVQLKHKDQPKVWDGRIPYLGLTPFRQRDAQYFLGVKASSTVCWIVSLRPASSPSPAPPAAANLPSPAPVSSMP